MSAEPSMEEILSSIKRIIAEEGDAPSRLRRAPRVAPVQPQALERPAAATPAATRYFGDEDADSEVLELSDPIPALDPVPHEASLEEAAPMPQTHAEPVAAVRQPAAAAPQPAPTQPIVSDRVAEASRSSLDNLSRLMARPEPAAEKAEGDSLEAVVRAMLRPMLREWLDANLPAIVETMVAGEIARITGQQR